MPLGLLDTAPVASQVMPAPSPVRPVKVMVGKVSYILAFNSAALMSGVQPAVSRASL